ncbi:DUF1963 domain-containing protein [Luteolibacter arcticus]|uniref:DUF1963 domain-containing protein n=1 Tax=Luteolibacter arcticus TaxID=1581411 RepID=A0ABT3GHC6_9BACT|nr:DUF1963 domain-containing protein [Luteolibacter arcticus]MCW1923024.1 DUF1963 domain-containing protein [Luteolibacter arcticus]
MATIHYEGLDGWWKSAAFWGALGIFLTITKSPPMPWVIIAIVVGAATGGANAFWLSKMKTKAISISGWVGLLVFAGLLYLLTNTNPLLRVPTMGFFALGCLFTSANSLVFGIVGTRAIKAVNTKNASWLSKLDPPAKRTGPPPPAPADQLSNREAFLAALPAAMQAEFRREVVEVIEATPFRSLESLPPTASALGGSPFLPPGTPWPERNGKPMQFLAMLNLAEIAAPAGALPAAGLLAIFYDSHEQPWGGEPEDLGSSVILYTPDPASALPAKAPGETGPSPLRQPVAFRRATALALSDAQESDFYALVRESPGDEKSRLTALHETMLESEPRGLRVMSPPILIQGDMDHDLEVAAAAHGLPEDTRWTLLIQLDSNDDLDWSWGDAGTLYFWLPSDDLAAGRFDRVWTILQCH